jgi:hypothetical protein
MAIRNPTPHDPTALDRDLDPRARGLLWVDFPNFWEDRNALRQLSRSQVLIPSTFDKLADVNKKVVIAHVNHILDVLRQRYLRTAPPPEVGLLRDHPVQFCLDLA